MFSMDQGALRKLVNSISKTVKSFKKSEVECLIKLFHSFLEKTGNTGLDQSTFREILHDVFGMTDDMLMNRVCFEVYYLNGDGYISREEIFDMLKNSIHQESHEEDADEGVRELVDLILTKMDYDNDGKVSFTDFERAVRQDQLLLEVFGPCLPEAKNCLHFEALAFRNL
ncbi:PREDICTED: EF-hand calcium-binding domain-containing protein 1-like isoform X2 [Chinchilla lanigera]|uniref:EF-hand calcium-binding domain-containing protein 1-like isoform X2 n=1 Tax=Chinchilla lanigera TaxID=34839 RepID=UPI00038EEA9D|nr:PREDICTED: EF-hand calcium-binding domain-containing protein 1-like isoform X2 [Chinchilla lanigera]